MKNLPLPECPFPLNDREAIRSHIETMRAAEQLRSDLATRSFGHRILRSFALRSQIARVESRAASERDYYGDLLNQENLNEYTAWLEAFTHAVEARV